MAADSPIQFHAILYCPRSNLELLGFGRQNHGLQPLRQAGPGPVATASELVPEYLRFLYGLVDSEDLPLNVSRETLQDNTLIRRIRNTLVKGVLDRLQKLADESPDDFLTFARQFGPILREGIAVDPPNRDRIARLLRFTSSHTESTEGPPTSLPDYVVAHAGRPEADLLRRRARPRHDPEEPEPGGLPPPETGSALPDRSDRRVRDVVAGHRSTARRSPRSTRPSSTCRAPSPSRRPSPKKRPAAASPGCSSCSARRSAIGSRRSVSRSG